jgi:competence protein ComGB
MGRKLKPIRLSEEDCEGIGQLMQAGFSFQEAMDLLEDQKTERCFAQMRRKLRRGETIQDFFPEYCPRELKANVEGFLSCMPFTESLAASIEIHKQESKLRKEIFRGMCYPTVLLAGVLAGIQIFNTCVMPNMLSLVRGFGTGDDGLEGVQLLIGSVSKAGLIAVLVLVCVVLFFLQPSRIAKTYAFIASHHSRSLLVQYASISFVRFYLASVKRKVSTQKSLMVIMSLKQSPLASCIAKSLNAGLLEGETMDQAVHGAKVEESLQRFFRIAVHSGGAETMMQAYLERMRLKCLSQVKAYSKVVQLLSYSAIGLVLITVYRVLMLPMKLIQTI